MERIACLPTLNGKVWAQCLFWKCACEILAVNRWLWASSLIGSKHWSVSSTVAAAGLLIRGLLRIGGSMCCYSLCCVRASLQSPCRVLWSCVLHSTSSVIVSRVLWKFCYTPQALSLFPESWHSVLCLPLCLCPFLFVYCPTLSGDGHTGGFAVIFRFPCLLAQCENLLLTVDSCRIHSCPSALS